MKTNIAKTPPYQYIFTANGQRRWNSHDLTLHSKLSSASKSSTQQQQKCTNCANVTLFHQFNEGKVNADRKRPHLICFTGNGGTVVTLRYDWRHIQTDQKLQRQSHNNANVLSVRAGPTWHRVVNQSNKHVRMKVHQNTWSFLRQIEMSDGIVTSITSIWTQVAACFISYS